MEPLSLMQYDRTKIPNLHENATKYFIIYSPFRLEGSNEKFLCQLSDTIKNVKCIQLDYIEFPNNIIPTENKTFFVVEDDYANYNTPSMFSYSFPKIFYTAQQTAALLQSELNTWSPGGYTYTVSVDTSNYFIITSTGQFSISGTLLVNIGFLDLVTIDNFYPSPVPNHCTPLTDNLRSLQPVLFRYMGVAISISPFSSETVINAKHYIRPTTFICPLTTNYGEMQFYYNNAPLICFDF